MLTKKLIYGCTVVKETKSVVVVGDGAVGGRHTPITYPESNDVVTNCDSTNHLSPKHVTNV